MPGNVNLNIPPRLIESARAAQYANREALNGRVLSERIKAKVKARRAAALRQQPATPDRDGGLPEAGDPLKWRIWRKRRPMGRRVTYTIEGVRGFDVITSEGATSIVDEWTIYAEWDTYEKQPIIRWTGLGGAVPGDVAPSPRHTVYLSTFIDTTNGDEAPPLITFARYDGFGIFGGPFADSIGRVNAVSFSAPFPFDSFPDPVYNESGYLVLNPAFLTNDVISLLNSEYNPLHAWNRLPAGHVVGYGVTSANPLANEYDIDRIKLAPGYVQTASVALSEEATYSVSATIKP